MALTSFRSIVLAATAVSMTVSTTNALSSYLKKIPNGGSFSKELGHPGGDSSQYTAFAKAFQSADYTWSSVCQATFPGSTMTNGAAFGDPCCTWTVGGTPDFTVTAFTTSPTEAKVCASAGGSTAPSSATTTTAPAVTTSAPSAPTGTSEEDSEDSEDTGSPEESDEAESPEDSEDSGKPEESDETESEAATDPSAPSSPSAPSGPSGGCRPKPYAGVKSSASLRH